MSIFSTALPSAASANSVAQALLPSTTKAKASATTPSTSATADSSTDITSSDFLTLLVTEMQNQDPTQPTDPTAYIQQLVGVNSLQQLIAINQGLTGAETTSATGQATGATNVAVASVSATPPITDSL